MSDQPLRIITFNYVPFAFQIVKQWAESNGHKIVLAITTPGPKSRPTPSYKGVVTNMPRDIDVLVTTRLRKVATPLIRELAPDLIVSYSFPYRITPTICGIPRFGAINLHPAPLPAYRGPNVMRMFYDGHPTLGSTVHWIAPDFDTGHILSRQTAPMPNIVTREAIFPLWAQTMHAALAEGAAKAIAGDPGQVQDESEATYAAPFTADERWLSWNDAAVVLQRQHTGLSLTGDVFATVDGMVYSIQSLEILAGENSAEAGTIVDSADNQLTIQTGDGVVRVKVQEPEGADNA